MRVNYSPENVKALFEGYSEEWWIAGGWAIDLFLGRQTREHEDVDVAILRPDEHKFRMHLQAWDIWPGLGDDRLEDRPIEPDQALSANREVLWCRPSSDSEWAFELLLNKTEGNQWLFKRDSRVRKPTDQIGSITGDGIPYLNPEIVLLFKAKNNFDKDQHDFEQVLPRLSPEAKTWLNKSLQLVHPNHPWLSEL